MRILILAAASIVALVAGLAFVVANSDDDPGTSERPDTTDVADPVEPIGLTAEPLPFSGRDIDGRYQTDLLGRPMTFTTSAMNVVRSLPGELRLIPQGLDGSNPRADFTRQAAVFLRLGGWKTGDEADDGALTDVGSIDPNDIEAWITDNDVIVDPRPTTLVGGYAASVFDVRVDPTSDLGVGCLEDEQPCFWYYAVSDDLDQTRGLRFTQIDATHSDRFWLITIEGEDPILIVAIAGLGNEAWLDEFEATTIATLELGGLEVAPLPTVSAD